MAAETQIPSPPPPPTTLSAGSPRELPDHVIERQLRRTGRRVKFIDLVTALMTLTAGLLVYLLLFVLLDHWVVGVGFWGRLVALLLLLSGVAWFFLNAVLPSLLGTINPVFAARAIEESQPALKNSLVNFLLLRNLGGNVHRVVLEAMRFRAASDLNQVSVETAVDRTRLIQVGYVLAGVLSLCVLYLILSPKNAFQSVSRAAAPWAEIDRPARVTIADVLPGDDEVFRGESVSVSAEIQGITPGMDVSLIYNSSDGQIVNQTVPMKLDDKGLRHVGLLPPEGGIQQDLTYQIRAGDAATKSFQLSVSAAPAILVERVEYDFPDYTKRPPCVVEGDGDISAVEGTRVTLRAKANYEIRSAWVEFDPPTESTTGNSGRGDRLPMEHQADSAWRAFTLKLQPDRLSQKYTCYELGFQTDRGVPSTHQILHHLRVTPDLKPEIQILTPTSERIEVPEDGSQKIEIRAVDPDFGLSDVGLRAVVAGSDLVDESLLAADQQNQPGQTVVQYPFLPEKLGLSAGDEVVYWAVAKDNRTDASSGLPDPNVQRTHNYHILITPARKTKPDASASGDSSENPDPDNQPNPDNAQSPEAQSPEAQSPEAQSPEDSAGQENQSEPMESADNSEEEASDLETMESGSAESGSAESGGAESGSGNQSEGGQDGSTATDKPSSGGEGNSEGTQESTRPSDNTDAPSSDSNSASGDKQGEQEPGANSRTEPLHDGEVFERAMRRLKEEQQTERGKEAGRDSERGQSDSDKPSPIDQQDEGQEGDSAASEDEIAGDHDPSQRESAQEDAPGADSQSEASGGEPKMTESTERPGASGENDPGSANPRATENDAQGMNGRNEPSSGTQTTREEQTGEEQTGEEQTGEEQTGEENGQDTDNAPGEEASGGKGQETGGGTGGSPGTPSQPGDGEPAMDDSQSPESTQQGNSGREASEERGGESNSREGTAENGGDPAEGDPVRKDAASDSSAQQASRQDPAAEDPAAEDPTAEDPTAEDPTAEDPTAEKRHPGSEESGHSNDSAPGGGQSTGADSSDGVQEAAAEGDEPQLEYARRVTDMVLEYLKDQQEEPDPRLLEKLGWTPEEMRIFLDRWMRLKQAAEQDTSAQHELDETLRGLGLRPPQDRIRRSRLRSDDVRGMSESGSRSAGPAKYREQIDAFKKGAARQGRP